MSDQHAHATLRRSGGFAGRAVVATLDTDDLPEPQAHDLRRLVGDALAESRAGAAAGEAGPRTPAPPVPDAMTYALDLEANGERAHLTLADPQVPPAARALIDRLMQGAAPG